MKTAHPAPEKPATPRIVHGARLLAALSVIWSGYAITDLMHSGPWGLTVAIAGDIGWITVLWAEAQRVRIGGYTWTATVAGWLIATGVGALLAIHGAQGPDGSAAQGAAGVFVIAVSKIVWMFALAADADPTAFTDEQETALADARRTQAYDAQLRHIALDGMEQTAADRIARIRADGRVTLAQDEVDFEVRLERHRMAGEIERNTPLTLGSYAPAALPAANTTAEPDEVAEQAINDVREHEQVDREQPNSVANTDPISPNKVREQLANKAVTSPNSDREKPIMADVVREQVRLHEENAEAVRAVIANIPDANKASVAAAVRRERRKAGPYL